MSAVVRGGKIAGRGRATSALPRDQHGRASPSRSKSGRRAASVFVRESARKPMSASDPPRSKGKRKATVRTPSTATFAVPSASPPNRDGVVQAPFADNGHDARDNTVSPKLAGEKSQHHVVVTDQRSSALSSDPTIALAHIKAHYEQRRDLLTSATALTLRMKAIVKARSNLPFDAEVSEKMIQACDYPPLATLYVVRDQLREHIGNLEKVLEQHAKALPGYREIWEPTSGLGALGLALILGETGDLRLYSTPAKVWKRMGLHVYQGRALWTKRPGMSADDWTAAGYCPRRRSLMYIIVNLGICTKQSRYRTLRDERRIYEREKVEAAGVKIVPAAKIPKSAPPGAYMSEGHILNRANRYVAKRLLKDLWRVWHGQATSDIQGSIASTRAGTEQEGVLAKKRLAPAIELPSPPPFVEQVS